MGVKGKEKERSWYGKQSNVELRGKDALFILLATAAHYMCALLRYAKVPSHVRLATSNK